MTKSYDYCKSFRDEAHQVWQDMTDAENHDIPRNEETTTESLLLSLARKHKGRGLEVKAFSKRVEGREGADWAFWFTDGSKKGIGARIQAKRFYSKKSRGGYDALYHQSDKQKELSKSLGGLIPNQCETLLNHCDKLVPIYIFYNSDKADISSVIWNSRLGGHPIHVPGFYFPPDWGISAASALSIKHAQWGMQNHVGDFPMVPWHCLICSCCWASAPPDASLTAIVSNSLRQLYSMGDLEPRTRKLEMADLGISFEPTENSPRWVRLLDDGIESENELLREMTEQSLGGVAIIRETEARDD